MKKAKIILAVIGLALGIIGGLIAIGIYQDRQNNPIAGCTQFETDTQYKGYHCKGQDIYIPPQN